MIVIWLSPSSAIIILFSQLILGWTATYQQSSVHKIEDHRSFGTSIHKSYLPSGIHGNIGMGISLWWRNFSLWDPESKYNNYTISSRDSPPLLMVLLKRRSEKMDFYGALYRATWKKDFFFTFSRRDSPATRSCYCNIDKWIWPIRSLQLRLIISNINLIWG